MSRAYCSVAFAVLVPVNLELTDLDVHEVVYLIAVQVVIAQLLSVELVCRKHANFVSTDPSVIFLSPSLKVCTSLSARSFVWSCLNVVDTISRGELLEFIASECHAIICNNHLWEAMSGKHRSQFLNCGTSSCRVNYPHL